MTYTVDLVNRAGGLITALPKADCTSVLNELNGAGGIEFSMPSNEPLGNLCKLFTEVQVRKDGNLVKWGTIVRRRADRAKLTVQCRGLWWYFSKRYVGRANRRNWLTNGDFEQGGTGWTAVGVTAAVVTTHHTSGTHGLELWQLNPGVDTFAWQRFTPAAGTFYTFVANIHIYGDQPYAGPAFENRGLLAQVISPGNQLVGSPAIAVIDASHQPGQTYRLEVGLTVPADSPSGTTVEVRLYAPGGHIMWDSVTATVMESLSYPMVDVATIANSLVSHAQDTEYGKSSLSVLAAVPASPLAGVAQSRYYQFADHAEIGAAVEDMAHAGLLDFDILTTDTTRTFRTWTPAKGTYKPGMALTITGDRADSCFDFNDDLDGEQTANSVVMLGDGDGPDREEGWAVDTTDLAGLVMERIEQTAPGTPIDALNPIAAEIVRASKKGVRIPAMTCKPHAAQTLGLDVGDTTDALIDYGGVQLEETVRVVQRDVNPRSDTATFTLNLA